MEEQDQNLQSSTTFWRKTSKLKVCISKAKGGNTTVFLNPIFTLLSYLDIAWGPYWIGIRQIYSGNLKKESKLAPTLT